MKCSCTLCGGLIEYDGASAGLEISCPHCKKLTRLAAYTAGPPPISTPAPAVRKTSRGWIIALIIAGALVLSVPVLGLLAAIAIPNFVKARQSSQRAQCVSNLRTMDGAKATWALEFKKQVTDVPSDSDLFGPEKYVKEKPVCPAGGTYSINAVEMKPTCSVPGHSF